MNSRTNVLGVGVSALTLDAARDLVLSARGQRGLGYICLGTAYGIEEARRDPSFRRAYGFFDAADRLGHRAFGTAA